MGKHDKSKNNNDTRTFCKIILVISVIAIIGILVYMAKIYFGGKEQTNADTTANTNQQNNIVAEQNNVEEKKDDNLAEEQQVPSEEVVKEPEETKSEETNNEENSNAQETNTSNGEESSIGNEEKAIQLAQKQYGTTDGVYFRIEQTLSNGVYEVSVRDEETTMEYAWYTIDVKNGTVK